MRKRPSSRKESKATIGTSQSGKQGGLAGRPMPEAHTLLSGPSRWELPPSRTGRKERGREDWRRLQPTGAELETLGSIQLIQILFTQLGSSMSSWGPNSSVRGVGRRWREGEPWGSSTSPLSAFLPPTSGFGSQGHDTDVQSASTPRQDSFSGCAELTSDFVGTPLAPRQVRGTSARHVGIQS